MLWWHTATIYACSYVRAAIVWNQTSIQLASDLAQAARSCSGQTAELDHVVHDEIGAPSRDDPEQIGEHWFGQSVNEDFREAGGPDWPGRKVLHVFVVQDIQTSRYRREPGTLDDSPKPRRRRECNVMTLGLEGTCQGNEQIEVSKRRNDREEYSHWLALSQLRPLHHSCDHMSSGKTVEKSV